MSKGTSKIQRAVALKAAKYVWDALRDACVKDRFIVAGSLRRMKQEVSDVEVLFVPIVTEESVPGELFDDRKQKVDHAAKCMEAMLESGVMTKRLNADGNPTWGPLNKYALLHLPGIRPVPVDCFATTEAAWFNALVCRTGPAELNLKITKAANDMGYSWRVGADGFYPITKEGTTDTTRPPVIVKSEQDVFNFVKIPYAEPKDRR